MALKVFPMGGGWYRKVLEVPPAEAKKRLILEFEDVYMNADVYVDAPGFKGANVTLEAKMWH